MYDNVSIFNGLLPLHKKCLFVGTIIFMYLIILVVGFPYNTFYIKEYNSFVDCSKNSNYTDCIVPIFVNLTNCPNNYYYNPSINMCVYVNYTDSINFSYQCASYSIDYIPTYWYIVYTGYSFIFYSIVLFAFTFAACTGYLQFWSYCINSKKLRKMYPKSSYYSIKFGILLVLCLLYTLIPFVFETVIFYNLHSHCYMYVFSNSNDYTILNLMYASFGLYIFEMVLATTFIMLIGYFKKYLDNQENDTMC